MSEKNTIERTIIPDKPKVIANEQLEIYIPEAAPGTKGVAEYSPVDFRVQDGIVRLRDSGKTAVENFNMDFNTGTLTIYYTDGNVLKTSIPTNYEPAVYTDSPFDIVEFTESSFIQISNEEYYLLVDLNEKFNITDTKYLAFLEIKTSQQVVDEGELNGYYTLSDGIFKTDGKLIVSAIAPYEGRLLVVKEEHFEIHEILKALKESVQHSEVEDHLDAESTNPVQNKVVKEALDGKLDRDINAYPDSGLSQGNRIIFYNDYFKNWAKYSVSQKGDATSNRVIVGASDGQIKQNLAPVNDIDLTNKLYVDETVDAKTMPTEWNAETTYNEGDVVIVKSTKKFVNGNTPVKTCRARKAGLLNVAPKDYTDENWFVEFDLAYMADLNNASYVVYMPGINAVQSKNAETGKWEWSANPCRVKTSWNSGETAPNFSSYDIVQVDYQRRYSCNDPVYPYNTTNKQYVDKKTHIFTSKYMLSVDSFLIQNINEFDDFHHAYNFQENRWMYGYEFSYDSPARIYTGVTEIVCGGSSPSTAFLNISLTDLGEFDYTPAEIRITNASMIEFWFCEYDSGECHLAIKTNGEVEEIWS